MWYDIERFVWFCGLGELWKEPLSVTDFSKTWAEVILKWKVFGSLYALHNKSLPFPQRLIRFLCCVLRQFCCCQEKQLPSHCFFFVSICWQLSHAVKEALKDIFRHSNKAEWVKTRIHSSIVDPDASVLWILEKKTRVCSFNSWKISNMVYIVDYKISPYLCLDESGLDKARILRRLAIYQ